MNQDNQDKLNIDVELATLFIKLLKGPFYDDDVHWSILLANQKRLSKFLEILGMKIVLQEADGYCFLKQYTGEEGSKESQIPRLVSRRRISFEATLLCVILREELDRFDTSNNESHILFVRKDEIRERIRIYFKEKTDETSLFRELDKYINQVESLGFLKKVNASMTHLPAEKEDVYEVKRIIKSKITPEFLNDFKQRLEVYVDAV